jgi:nuclear-control-of-ATPase protein 2
LITVSAEEEDQDEEETALEDAIVRKLAVTIYGDALDTYLAQAIEVEAEAEWWAGVERSKLAVAWFLLQSRVFVIVSKDIANYFW